MLTQTCFDRCRSCRSLEIMTVKFDHVEPNRRPNRFMTSRRPHSRFFELPDDEWKWHFDVPDFQVRFVALDFNHISDRGTTWQTCHDFGKDSEQFRWYDKLMANRPSGFVITFYNERNASMRGQEKGAWHEVFRKGNACITGFGHFAERAEVDGLPYFNTSLQGRGDKYPDPQSKVLKSEDNYVLMTLTKGKPTMTIELKNLDGQVLDRVEIRSSP